MLSRLCRENSTIAPQEILRCIQKLLDRVLFCAFCEDRGLLPAESLKHAFEHRDPYNPRPVWLNFRGLFRAIDEGNAGLNIPAYNGGLFALDESLDGLQVPDEVCAYFKDLGDYDYRPVREVADADEFSPDFFQNRFATTLLTRAGTDSRRTWATLSTCGAQTANSYQSIARRRPSRTAWHPQDRFARQSWTAWISLSGLYGLGRNLRPSSSLGSWPTRLGL